MAMTKYYIIIGKEQKGGFSLEELQSQNISAKTMVWREGMEDWEEAGKLDELKEIIAKMPPSLPKSQNNNITEVSDEIKIVKPKQEFDNNRLKISKKTSIYILSLDSYPSIFDDRVVYAKHTSFKSFLASFWRFCKNMG